MRYVYDNDLHIHSGLSSCSNDPEQTPERILEYAKNNGLKTVCLTDHFWDETVEGASEWYKPQNYTWISQAKPLPEADGIRFLFGCETDFDRFMTVGLAKEHFDRFDFVIIPTTHMHMQGFTLTEEEGNTVKKRADLWVKRLDALLEKDLPFEKIGIAHLTCSLIAPSSREDYLAALKLIPDEDMERLFEKAAVLGVGIELNSCDMMFAEEEADIVLRPYRIAKNKGCKFYMGSDAHHPAALDKAVPYFERAIDYLKLEETDKFIVGKSK